MRLRLILIVGVGLFEVGLMFWMFGADCCLFLVNLTNMLWVEYPVGVGFSIGEVTASTEEEIAADFVKFFKNFEV